jgi:hypothetical protein
MNSGYLKELGFEFETHLNDFGTLRLELRPIKAVGVRARFMKFNMGYQNQCCMNIINPMMAFYLRFPSLVKSEIVAFLPAAFMIPVERIAPILERMSSLLSSIILL